MLETADHNQSLTISNDYHPYLAVVDPDAYVGFFAEEWTEAQLHAHFVAQMAEKRLLLWFSTLCAIWQIPVRQRATPERGFRAACGPIVASKGRLLVAGFDSLLMVAQFADASLPGPHEEDQLITLTPGEYQCRIIQLADLGHGTSPGHGAGEVGFALELTRSDCPLPTWEGIAWDDLRLVRRSILDNPDPTQVAATKVAITKLLTPPERPLFTVSVEFLGGIPALEMVLISEMTGSRWRVLTIGLGDPPSSSSDTLALDLHGRVGTMNLASLDGGILAPGERLRAYSARTR